MTPTIEMASTPVTNRAFQKEFYDEKERELFEKEYEMVNELLPGFRCRISDLFRQPARA